MEIIVFIMENVDFKPKVLFSRLSVATYHRSSNSLTKPVLEGVCRKAKDDRLIIVQVELLHMSINNAN
jgi:hypothetical protein